MISKWRYLVSQLNRRLWVRAALYAVGAVATALIAALVGPWLPLPDAELLGAGAVKDILTIMASSMLAVATFSLSVMVSAYAAASSSTTPRATALLMEDRSAQRALSTFIGAFLFSIVGLIALSTGLYGESERLVLFVVTLIVIVLVVVTLLRWIDTLAGFGRVGDTIDRVERAAREAIQSRIETPYLGGRPAMAVPDDAVPIHLDAIGYVQHIDTGRLQDVAEEHELTIHLALLPGAYVDPGRPVAHVAGGNTVDETLRGVVADAFVVGDSRSFDQDPRFGLVVLSEIASRALSPAVNDPGTAIDVIGTVQRLLTRWWWSSDTPAPEPQFARVYVPGLEVADVMDDAFDAIGRDGAGLVEVGIKIQRALDALHALEKPGLRTAALRHADVALERASAALRMPQDIERLRAVSCCVRDAATAPALPARQTE